MPGAGTADVNTEGFGGLTLTADRIAARTTVYYTDVSGFGDMTIDEGETSVTDTIVINPNNVPLPGRGNRTEQLGSR